MTQAEPPTSTDFVISRVFDAPRDLVWKCFTEPERMKHWWGPKGFTVIASKMDLRPGGTYHYGMKAPDGAPCGASSSIARSCRRSGWCSSIRSRTRAGGTHASPDGPDLAAGNALDLHLRGAAGRQDQVHVRWSPHNATDGRAQDLRCRPRQHAPGLGRNHGAARRLSRHGQGLSRLVRDHHVDHAAGRPDRPHQSRARRAARTGVADLDRARAHGGVVGTKGLHQPGLRDGRAGGRRVAARHARPDGGEYPLTGVYREIVARADRIDGRCVGTSGLLARPDRCRTATEPRAARTTICRGP